MPASVTAGSLYSQTIHVVFIISIKNNNQMFVGGTNPKSTTRHIRMSSQTRKKAQADHPFRRREKRELFLAKIKSTINTMAKINIPKTPVIIPTFNALGKRL